MSSPSKRKGTAFERLVADYLAEAIPGVDRRALHGNHDHGDIAGIPGWVLELKATRAIDLAGALDEARLEAKNAGVANYAAVVKRRSKGVAQAYFVMTLADAVRLLAGR